MSRSNTSRVRLFWAGLLRYTGNPMMKMKARYIHVAGVLKGVHQRRHAHLPEHVHEDALRLENRLTTLGNDGGEPQCPSDGDGLSGMLAPIEKIAMFGTPIATLCTRSSCSAVSGKRSSGPSGNVAPGIARNLSFAYSICEAITLAGPYHCSSQRQ